MIYASTSNHHAHICVHAQKQIAAPVGATDFDFGENLRQISNKLSINTIMY